MLGDVASSRPRATMTFSTQPNTHGQSQCQSVTYLDSPSTPSSIVYKVTAAGRQDNNNGGSTVYINRSVEDRDEGGYDPRGASSLIVMEIL